MAEAYRGGVSVTEKKPASREFPGDSTNQYTQLWEQGQDPGYQGDKPAKAGHQSVGPMP